MGPSFLTYVMMAAIGFAVGGVLMSGFFMVTGKRLGFALTPGPVWAVPLHLILRLVAGPAILVHNVFTMEDDSFGLVVAGVSIAACWSLGSGALLMTSLGQL